MNTLINKDAEEPDVDGQWVKKLNEIDLRDDSLSMYLREVDNIRHLTAAHERWLARKIEEGIYIEDLEAEFHDLTGRGCKGVDLHRFFMTQIHGAVPLINMICRFYQIRNPQSLKDLLTNKDLNDRLHGESQDELLKYVAVALAAYRNTNSEEIHAEIQDLSLTLRSLPTDVHDMFAISPRLAGLNKLEDMIIYKRHVENYEPLLKRHFNHMKYIGRRAKQYFIVASLHLVLSASKNYMGRGMSRSDLIQEGNIGLMRAVDKFDYRIGTQFKAYATYWIRQAISRAVADQGRTIRVPVYMVENINNLTRVEHLLTQKYGREPTIEEISIEMDVTPERVREILKSPQELVSLETPIQKGSEYPEDEEEVHIADGEGSYIRDFVQDYDWYEDREVRRFPADEGTSYLKDFIEDASDTDSVDAADYQLLKERIEDVLLTLNEREARVLQLRFGLEDGRSRTLEEVGRDFHVTRERIRQIEAKALRKLRHPNRSKKLRDFLE